MDSNWIYTKELRDADQRLADEREKLNLKLRDADLAFETEREKHRNELRDSDARYLNAQLADNARAITKAEAAQNAYNVIHNDLVRKNELMQTRTDADKDRSNTLEIIRAMNLNFESKIDDGFKSTNLRIDELKESRDIIVGKTKGSDKVISYVFGVLGMAVGFLTLLLKLMGKL